MSKTGPAALSAGTQWRLDDRVALVTGASAGLGARFARVLHAAGAHVIVTGDERWDTLLAALAEYLAARHDDTEHQTNIEE